MVPLAYLQSPRLNFFISFKQFFIDLNKKFDHSSVELAVILFAAASIIHRKLCVSSNAMRSYFSVAISTPAD